MIMMACMVSVKATSLIPTALSAAGIAMVYLSRSRNLLTSLRLSVGYGLGALVLGSVWYVKSWIVTGNPFFPFAYSVFGGRHWSADNALVYAQSQAAFGMGHAPQDLLLTPWNVTLFVLFWNIPAGAHYFNDFSAAVITLSPMLVATLFLPALWNVKLSKGVQMLGLFGLLSLILWFGMTQQIRYLMPALPTYCVLSAVVVVEIWKVRSITKYALGTLFVVSLAFSAYLAGLLSWQEAPVALGILDHDTYITSGFHQYDAMQWINRSTPESAGILIYGEPEDFYLDRNHMWGEPGHGIVIPYDRMRSSVDLRSWMLAHGYQYILINAVNAKIGPGSGMNSLVYGLTYGSGNEPVFQDKALTVWQVS
jgi:hypothetical protein